MQLDRTTIIPTDDINLARTRFQSDVCSGRSLVVVVLGDDDTSVKAAECADRRAGVVVQGIGRKVVWIKDRYALADEIKKLKPGAIDILKEDLAKIVGFSVSLKVTTMNAVRASEEINFSRMETAFLEAGTV